MPEPIENEEVAEEVPAVEEASEAEETTTVEPETFDRAYVENLRKESAGYRTRAKSYEEVFDGYQPEEQQVWLDLAKTFKEDPFAAADRMAQIAENVRASREAEAEQTGGEAKSLEEKPLTRAEYDQIRSEERRQEEQASLIKGIEREAADMGYTVGSRDYINLLYTAQNETNGDLKKAHEALETEKQKLIDEFLAKKQKDANGAVVPPVGGGTASGEQQLKTFADAKRAAMQRAEAATRSN